MVWVFHAVDDLSKWVELVATITACITVGVIANVTVLTEREGEVCSSVTRCRHRGERSHDGCGVAGHLSDLDDVAVDTSIRELADAVGGLVELGGDVLNLRWRVLLVHAPPAVWLLRGIWLVRVVTMLVWVVVVLKVVLRLVVLLLVVLLRLVLLWMLILVASCLVSELLAIAFLLVAM